MSDILLAALCTVTYNFEYFDVTSFLKLSILVFYRRFLPRRPYDRYILAMAICTGGFSIAIAIVSRARSWPPFVAPFYRLYPAHL
jgi:hypothetical protein